MSVCLCFSNNLCDFKSFLCVFCPSWTLFAYMLIQAYCTFFMIEFSMSIVYFGYWFLSKQAAFCQQLNNFPFPAVLHAIYPNFGQVICLCDAYTFVALCNYGVEDWWSFSCFNLYLRLSSILSEVLFMWVIIQSF